MFKIKANNKRLPGVIQFAVDIVILEVTRCLPIQRFAAEAASVSRSNEKEAMKKISKRSEALCTIHFANDRLALVD